MISKESQEIQKYRCWDWKANRVRWRHSDSNLFTTVSKMHKNL